MNREQIFSEVERPHAGNLLLAHPRLLDPNFRRTVILLLAHSEKEGSVGVILNRAIGQTLGEYDPDLATSTLANVPLFVGGPVATDQLILVAWKWSAKEGTFMLYFGIDGEKAHSIFEDDPAFQLRGFLGHVEWTEGQLDAELGRGCWLLSGFLAAIKDEPSEIDWYDLLCQERPELGFLANAPADTSLN